MALFNHQCIVTVFYTNNAFLQYNFWLPFFPSNYRNTVFIEKIVKEYRNI